MNDLFELVSLLDQGSLLYWPANALLTEYIKRDPSRISLGELLDGKNPQNPIRIPNTLMREAYRLGKSFPYENEQGYDKRIDLSKTVPELMYAWKDYGVSEYDLLYLLARIPWTDPNDPLLRKILALGDQYCFLGGKLIQRGLTTEKKDNAYLPYMIRQFVVVRENYNADLVAELCNLVSGDGLVVRRGAYGHGLFVDRDFREGEQVCTYAGFIVSEDTNMSYKTFKDIREKGSCYIVSVGPDGQLFIDAKRFWQLKEKGRWINHSSENPNVEFVSMPQKVFDEELKKMVNTKNKGRIHVIIRAIRDISVGEEIVINYGDTYNAGCMGEDWPVTESNKDHFIEKHTPMFD